MNIYLQVLDDQVRLPHENPTIGLVLCKEANRTIAEYAVRDYAKPMGWPLTALRQKCQKNCAKHYPTSKT